VFSSTEILAFVMAGQSAKRGFAYVPAIHDFFAARL
jgi:hypothetical protein